MNWQLDTAFFNPHCRTSLAESKVYLFISETDMKLNCVFR
jgi:hypothetical protein